MKLLRDRTDRTKGELCKLADRAYTLLPSPSMALESPAFSPVGRAFSCYSKLGADAPSTSSFAAFRAAFIRSDTSSCGRSCDIERHSPARTSGSRSDLAYSFVSCWIRSY